MYLVGNEDLFQISQTVQFSALYSQMFNKQLNEFYFFNLLIDLKIDLIQSYSKHTMNN